MIKAYANKLIVRQLRRRVEKLLKTHDLTMITVTGTVGKTSAKLAIGQTLEAVGRKVCFSEDSYNTEIGISLALFGLKVPDRLASPVSWRGVMTEIDKLIADYPYDTIVMEVSEDERDLMMNWVELLDPQISVITSVSPAHMLRFESLDDLRDDTIALGTVAERVLYNADNELLQTALKTHKQASGFGLKLGDIKFTNIARGQNGLLKADLTYGKNKVHVKTQLVARHALLGLLAGASVAHELKYSPAQIAKALGNIAPVKGRMRLLSAVNDAKILDDTYNSSPAAVFAALDTLMELPARSHIAVLGSMNELGAHSEALHREVGTKAAQAKLDLLVTIGKDAEDYIIPAAIEAGMDAERTKRFRTPYEAGHYLKKLIKADDLVLLKGSQNGVFAEEASRILLDPSLHPARELVRQSKVWKKRKKKSFGL